MLLVEGFQKFAGIPFGISRIFESLMPQQISANRRKNRSIQVKKGGKHENKKIKQKACFEQKNPGSPGKYRDEGRESGRFSMGG